MTDCNCPPSRDTRLHRNLACRAETSRSAQFASEMKMEPSIPAEGRKSPPDLAGETWPSSAVSRAPKGWGDRWTQESSLSGSLLGAEGTAAPWPLVTRPAEGSLRENHCVPQVWTDLVLIRPKGFCRGAPTVPGGARVVPCHGQGQSPSARRASTQHSHQGGNGNSDQLTGLYVAGPAQ